MVVKLASIPGLTQCSLFMQLYIIQCVIHGIVVNANSKIRNEGGLEQKSIIVNTNNTRKINFEQETPKNKAR